MMNWALLQERDIRKMVVKCGQCLETSLKNCSSGNYLVWVILLYYVRCSHQGLRKKCIVEFLLLFTTFNKPEIITKWKSSNKNTFKWHIKILGVAQKK